MSEENKLPTILEGESLGNIIVHEDLKVSIDGEHIIKAYVSQDLSKRNKIRVGMYLQVPLYTGKEENKELNDELLCRVDEISYETSGHYDEYTTSEKGSSSPDTQQQEKRTNMVLGLHPISIIEKEMENGEIVPSNSRNIDTTPKPQSSIYEANNKDFLRKGLNIPKKGITIGKLAVNGSEVPPNGDALKYNVANPGVRKEKESAIWRHGIIAGSTGKGKTHTTKNILRQFAGDTKYNIKEQESDTETKKLPSIIIIDPENEYSEMAEDTENLENKEKIENLKYDTNFEVGGINQDNTNQFELTTYTPQVRNTNNPNVKNQKEFSVPFKVVNNSHELAIGFEPEIPTRNTINDALNAYFSGSQNPNYEDFQDKMEEWSDEIEKENPDNSILPKALQDVNDRTWQAAKQRLSSGVFKSVFDAPSTKTLLEIGSEMFEPGRVSVIPTGHLTESQQNLVVMSVLSLIVDNKIGRTTEDCDIQKIRDTPMILGLDEAHNYLSEGSNSIRKRYIVNKFREAAKRGRKYKLGLLMVTQNPEDIDSEIRKQSNTRIYLGMEGETLEKLNITKEEKNRIKDFGKGQMMVKAPDLQPVEVMGFEFCVTKHSG